MRILFWHPKNTSFFQVTVWSPKWRSLNPWKGHLKPPKRPLGRTEKQWVVFWGFLNLWQNSQKRFSSGAYKTRISSLSPLSIWGHNEATRIRVALSCGCSNLHHEILPSILHRNFIYNLTKLLPNTGQTSVCDKVSSNHPRMYNPTYLVTVRQIYIYVYLEPVGPLFWGERTLQKKA